MGSKTEKVNRWLDHRKDIGILLLRIFIGIRLFYGVIDNIVNWDRMIEFSGFLQSQGFSAPIFAAILSAYSQLIGSLCIFFGYKIRVASFVLIINFIVAMIVHLKLNDSFEAMTPPLAMLFSCLAFIFTGPGKYAILEK
ncbi:MAG: DoxX family protein [Chryseolinea sp.]